MALNDDETAREFREELVKKLFGGREENYEL
jgi:ATP-dependent Clp protease adapter protein ClpS